MKRSSSSEFGSEPKRFETAYPPPSQFQQQQQLQMQAQQQQQYQAQQQFQQQMQAQQIQAVQQQQQQQFAANQQFFNPAAAFYPMNSVNYSPYVPAQSPMMYNSSPTWNFMPSPSPFFNPPPAPVPPGPPTQPPLPPPDLKPEKPPLPKEPEPGGSSTSTVPPTEALPPVQQLANNGVGRPSAPTLMGGVRMRGGMNGGFNGFNPTMGMRGLVGGRPAVMGHNGMAMRGRRRNAHFFPQMPAPQMIVPPMELHHMGEIPDFARLLEEDQPAGPEKLTIYLNNNDTGRVQVNKKAKRKPMSTRYTRTKMWVREEAEAAIALEKEFNRMQKRPMLILKFPDPDLNKFIVKKYSPSIDSVHFQQPSTPRYCFVQLKEDADVEKVISTIRQIPFGSGTITCELKNQLLDDQPVTPEEIDPYTLYIGNLPTHISVRVVKQYFPNAQRIDIGYAQRMRYTRYAFIRYNSVAEAMDSYKRTVNALLDSRSLIVRFRRQKGNIGLPGETKLNAPRREGREVLPETAPKPLDHEDDMHILETFETEMETVQIDEDDEDLEEEEDDNAQPEEAPSTSPKKVVLNTKSDPSIATPASLVIPDADASVEIIWTSDTAQESSNNSNPNDCPEAPAASKDKEPPTLNSTNSAAEDKENKDRVIEEANAIIRRNAEAYREELKRKFIEKEFRSIPQMTPTHLESNHVKLEDDDSDDSSNDGINYLGTRVKEEPRSPERQEPRGPVPPHIFVEVSQLTGDEGRNTDDEEPEEEDDAIEDRPANKSRSKCLGEWDAMRHDELNTKEDKPDLHQIGSLSNFESAPVVPIPAIVQPKTELDDGFDPLPKKKKRDTDMIRERDELSEMFRQMNSDPECEDEDTYFGTSDY